MTCSEVSNRSARVKRATRPYGRRARVTHENAAAAPTSTYSIGIHQRHDAERDGRLRERCAVDRGRLRDRPSRYSRHVARLILISALLLAIFVARPAHAVPF